MRAQSRPMGSSQRSSSCTNARWSSCVWTRHIACSSVIENSDDKKFTLPIACLELTCYPARCFADALYSSVRPVTAHLVIRTRPRFSSEESFVSQSGCLNDGVELHACSLGGMPVTVGNGSAVPAPSGSVNL